MITGYIQLELKCVFGIMKFQDLIFVRKLFKEFWMLDNASGYPDTVTIGT